MTESSLTGGVATQTSNGPVIAYLAPELPEFAATFVYEELIGLEARGYSILPVTVRRPPTLAVGQAALASRTQCLYDGRTTRLVVSGLASLPTFGRRALTALGWLAADMAEIGWSRPESWKLVYQFLAGVKLARLLRRGRCAHLHVHFAHTPSQIAMYASALSGIPFTLTAHANDIFERGQLLARKAARAKKFLTISDFNRRHLERVGVAPDRLAVVRCGVSFAVNPAPAPAASRDIYRLGSLGRLVEKKGMDILLRAVAELRSRPYRVELEIAGDGPLTPQLEALSIELGLGDQVRFLGSLPHDKVVAWMRQLDAFVLACKQDANGDMDGIPVVLMEAMSQSIPVISTRLSGIPELVVDESTGLLAEPGDHRDLARRIDRLLSSVELRQQLAERAVAHVASEFGVATNLDRLLGWFALAEPARPANDDVSPSPARQALPR